MDLKKISNASGMVLDFLEPMELNLIESIAILETAAQTIRISLSSEAYLVMIKGMAGGQVDPLDNKRDRKLDD